MENESFLLGLSKMAFQGFCGMQDVQTVGLENFIKLMNQDAPRLTLANHQSYLDDPFIWSPIPLSIRESDRFRHVVAARENFDSLKKWFSQEDNLRLLFVDRGKGLDQECFFKANEILAKNGWIHIFPEGKIIQESGALMGKFKPGLANLILTLFETTRQKMNQNYKHASTVEPLLVPIAHFGLHNVLPMHQWPTTGQKVFLFYGEPIPLEKVLIGWCKNGEFDLRDVVRKLTNYIEESYLSFYLKCFNQVFSLSFRRESILENELGYCHHLDGLVLLKYAPEMARIRKLLAEKKNDDSILDRYIKLLRMKEQSLLCHRTLMVNEKLTKYNIERMEYNLFSTRKSLKEAYKKMGDSCCSSGFK